MKNTTLMIAAASMGLIVSAQAEEHKKDRPQREVPPAMLEKFDQDGDGKLSKSERKEMIKAHRKELMEKFDTDRDGKLSEEERTAMRAARKAEMREKFDKDGDGELSKQERMEMRKAMKDGRRHGPHGKHHGKHQDKHDDKHHGPHGEQEEDSGTAE